MTEEKTIPRRSKKKTEEEVEEAKTYETKKGLVIPLRKPDAVFIQSVVNSVKMPDVPTYEARTSSGRVEVHVMDKESAEQTPGGMDTWRKYQIDVDTAATEKANRSLRAMFLEGTEVPEGIWMDPKWERRMKIVGVDLPKDEEELWVFYLMSYLDAEDINGLTEEVMRLTGIDEEYIEAAKESFRDSVRPDDEREVSP
jgi:hypothetical protein